MVLMISIRPCKDRSLQFIHFKEDFTLSIFVSQFKRSISVLLYPKKIPRALTQLFVQFIPASASFLFLPRPIHKPSVFPLFNFRPEFFSKLSTILNSFNTESSLLRKWVVSSASCVILIYIFFPFTFTFRPSFGYFLIWIAKISTTSKNRRALKGHSCLSPLWILNGVDSHPLLITQDSTLLYMVFTQMFKWISKIELW